MEKIQIPEDLKDLIYESFRDLPLKNKLVVYSKLLFGNSFKPTNNDFFDLNRRSTSKIFRTFIDNVKEKADERSKQTKY